MAELASDDEPLVLADGTKIDPKTGRPARDNNYVAVPSNTQAQREVTETRRHLADLPAPPKQMNGLSVVCFYKLLGVPHNEIAHATGLSEERIGQITMTDTFNEIKDAIVSAIMEQDADDVRNIIAQQQKAAAARVGEMMFSRDEKVALTAANSMLDRGGNRPADIVEHRHIHEGGLRIEYVRKDQGDGNNVDVDFEEIEGEEQ